MYVTYINKRYESFYNICKEKVELPAIIISEPTENEYTVSYVVKGTNGIYNGKKFLIYINKKYSFKYGDLVNITGSFNKPNSERNYKGFNYKDFLKTKKIYGTIKVTNIEFLEHNKANRIFSIANSVKEKIKNNIDLLFSKETSGLLIGLILGEKTNLSDEILNSFRDSNLSHLLAVSGAHITYIIIGLSYILDFIKVSKRKTSIFIIVFLIIFMFITGFSPSVVRACIMGIILMGANVLYRKNDFLTSISLSFLLILLENPFLIKNTGLQLSYLGTIGIVYFNKDVSNLLIKAKLNKKLAILFSVPISAQLMIMPIIALNYNCVYANFLISNILATFPFAVCIILGFITILFSFILFKVAKVLAIVLNFFLQILLFVSKTVSKISFLKFIITTPSIITIIFYYGFLLFTRQILYIYNKKGNKRKIEANTIKFIKTKRAIYLIIIVLVLIFTVSKFSNIYRLINKNLDIYFVDVGQGDSTFIITPHNKTILIDGGDGKNDVLLPYLLDRKTNKIDFLIVSHFDSDHCNGLTPIIESLKVNKLYISKQSEITEEYKNLINIAKKRKIKVTLVEAGYNINIEKNIHIEFLYPENNLKFNDLNNNSIVCKLSYNRFKMLFTGDIEEKAEEIILNKDINLKADILKIAHHGSKTSSTNEFLKAVSPKISLIGVGENNKFGHPNDNVLKNIKDIRMQNI